MEDFDDLSPLISVVEDATTTWSQLTSTRADGDGRSGLCFQRESKSSFPCDSRVM
jgi:hypothetical protein